MHNVVKWPNILLKSCGVNIARFLIYVWEFYNIVHEMVKTQIIYSNQIIFRACTFSVSLLLKSDKVLVLEIMIQAAAGGVL